MIKADESVIHTSRGERGRTNVKKAHLVMPMGGAGSRFKNNGFELPKPVIEIEGKPFFYWAARSIEKFVDLADITFVVLQNHVTKFHLGESIRQYFHDAKIIVIPEVTPGPVFTCLEGLRDIADEAPVIFNDCDHMFRCDSLYGFLSGEIQNVDGALLTFESSSPNFSYVQYDDRGDIIGTAEKQVVSHHAICGAYLFRNAGVFRSVAAEYLKECPYKESFISGMYNVMCAKKMNVKDFLLDYHVEFGTPEEYKQAIGSVFFSDLK